MHRHHYNILYSVNIRNYLNSHTKGPYETSGYRIWDADLTSLKDFPEWAEMFNKVKLDPVSLPKFCIFDKETLIKVIPFPDSEEKALDILKLYGGR